VKVKNPNRYDFLSLDDRRLVELLQRHKERIREDLPAAIFGALDDDPLPVAVLVYYTPTLTISLIVDRPETRPFMRITKVVAAFERRMRAAGVTRYYTLVAQSDIYYRHLVEKWGFREETRDGGNVLYERLLNDERSHYDAGPDGVRPWRVADWDALYPLVMEFLQEASTDGNDFLPTGENAVRILERCIRAAEDGDPVLLAVRDRRIVGFAAWIGAESWLETKSRLCMGLGTYVAPKARRQGWSRKLREQAFELARGRYDKIEGIALHKAGYQASTAVGFRPAGILVRKELSNVL
jgi:GNAT superfamily N-acetyltransferase